MIPTLKSNAGAGYQSSVKKELRKGAALQENLFLGLGVQL